MRVGSLTIGWPESVLTHSRFLLVGLVSVLFSLWSGEIIFCYVQEAEDEEDPSNLQLAWEMLEVAKIAYSKQKEVQNF